MAAPLNISGLTALAMQLAADYYNRQALIAVDEVFPGTYNWQPEGIHDLIWSITAKTGQGSMRAMKTQWNQTIKEFQHSTPIIFQEVAVASGVVSSSGQPPFKTNIPKGVGGHSVSQAIRDTDTIQVTSQSSLPQPRLSSPMDQAQLFACFTSVDCLPTQNRWVGAIDNERILFEGTNGGTSGGVSGQCSGGFFVNIVSRGIEGTWPSAHSGPTLGTSPGNSGQVVSGGPAIIKQIPNTTFGINLSTYEKGQFVYPSDWNNGIQGLNVVPQTQTVFAFDGLGTNINGIRYYSGQVESFDPTINLVPWVNKEFIWVVERNQSGIAPGIRYDGQFAGYSPNSGTTSPDASGNVSGIWLRSAPVYLINSSGLASGQASGSTNNPGFVCNTPTSGLPPGLSLGGFPGKNPSTDPCSPCQPFVAKCGASGFLNGPFSGFTCSGSVSGTMIMSGPQSGISCPPPFGFGGGGFPAPIFCTDGSGFIISGLCPGGGGFIQNCCFPSGTQQFSGTLSGQSTPTNFLTGPTPGIGFITIPPVFPGQPPTIVPVPIFPPFGQGGVGGGGGNVTAQGNENCFIDTTPSNAVNNNVNIVANFKGIAVKGIADNQPTGLTCNNFQGNCPDAVGAQIKAGEFLFDPCSMVVNNLGLALCTDGTGNPTQLRRVGIGTRGVTQSFKYLDDTCNIHTLCFKNGVLVAFN